MEARTRTGKIRQFDIRAIKRHGQLKLALAVECKNIRPNHPLLLSAVPRTSEEAFHTRIRYVSVSNYWATSAESQRGRDSAYTAGEMVGRKTDQVGRENTPDQALVSDDSVTFDKLNQAVHSCRDLIEESVLSRSNDSPSRVIVPVLVVPANVLWQVEYSSDGVMKTAPRPVSRTTFFIGHSWSIDMPNNPDGPITYCISHLEVTTFDALPSALQEMTNLFV
jgi:hypothetical protein